MGILATLALSAALSQAHVGDVSELPAHIETLDWAYLAKVSDFYTFFKAHPRQPVFWLRIERPSGDGFNSQMFEFEVDCASERARVVNRVSYKEANLRSHEYTQEEDGAWQNLLPGSVPAQISETLCELQGR